MNKEYSKNNIFRENILAFLGVCLCIYFAYHLMLGQRSYFEAQYLKEEIGSLKQNLSSLELRKASNEKKVVSMRPSSLDAVVLEERVRHVLGYVSPDEAIFPVFQNSDI